MLSCKIPQDCLSGFSSLLHTFTLWDLFLAVLLLENYQKKELNLAFMLYTPWKYIHNKWCKNTVVNLNPICLQPKVPWKGHEKWALRRLTRSQAWMKVSVLYPLPSYLLLVHVNWQLRYTILGLPDVHGGIVPVAPYCLLTLIQNNHVPESSIVQAEQRLSQECKKVLHYGLTRGHGLITTTTTIK